MTLNSKIELRKVPFASLLCVTVLAMTGCTTSKLDLPDSERFPAPQATITSGEDAAAMAANSGPNVTGKYPGFSGPLRAASVQMSDDDAAKIQQRMAGLSRKRKSGTISEAEYKVRVDELRKLAAEHGIETIKEIRN